MSGNIAEIYGGEFDTNRDDAATGFEALPAGWYPVEVGKAEIKTTKAGTGKFLHLEMTVLGEQYAGRMLFPNINLLNPNAKAVEIGMRELAGLGQAAGLAAITDTDDLLGKQVEVRVKIEQQEGYEADNKVTAYRALSATVTPGPAKPAQTAGPTAAAVGAAAARITAAGGAPKTTAPAAKRPWER